MTTDIRSLTQSSSGKTAGGATSPGYRIMGGLGWTARDKLIFVISAIGAIIVGAFIVFH